ncbi:uncharacterized protein LOC134216878 [Armigeres subalbatus]|uniref:uncharacterized protein LOC134216878 n=1 Tax=Armigeres subalbatus TaxID=124917 RepID=UPI002ED41127
MSESKMDFTTTPCEACGELSTQDEEMIGCDSCEHWFHSRCVEVTAAAKKDKKWFCPEGVCQAVSQAYQKQKKSSRSRKAPEDSDRASVKSNEPLLPALPSSVEERIRAMDAEKKRLEEEMDAERVIREKELEIKNALKERRMVMERELREKELQQDRELREKEIEEKNLHFQRELQEKKEHLSRVLMMEKAHQEQMYSVERKLKEAETDNVNLKLYAQKSEDVEDNNSESSESDAENERESNVTTPNGLEQPRQGPSKAQLAARSGLTKKLPNFSGKPEEWPLFFGAYQASNEACGYSDVENLVRLQDCLKGPALESVRGQLIFPKSVPRIIAKLRQFNGCPEQVLQNHLGRARKLEPPRADELASFISFGNAAEQLCDHLEAADLTLHFKRHWVHYKRKKNAATLRTFTDFLSGIFCEANVNIEYKSDTKVVVGVGGRNRPKEKAAVYSHSEVMSSGVNETYRKQQKPCKVCQRSDHRLRFCQDFKDLSHADRMKVVARWKLCQVCLNDHWGQCRFKIRCNVGDCREPHNPLIHPVEGVVGMSAHIRSGQSVIFRMVPVKVHSGGRSITVLAFLDEGASVTLIDSKLADRLGLVGVQEKLTIKWTADVSRVEKSSRRMNVWISAVSPPGNAKMLLQTVHTVEKLMLPHQALNAEELAMEYEHIRVLEVTSYDGRPGILIGANNIHSFAPMEAKIGTTIEPIAVRCKLGWTVYGPRHTDSTLRGSYLGYHQNVSNEEIHELLKNHYALEESVVSVQQESLEDKRARSIMERTTRRLSGRFETGLLWKTDEIHFPDSYPMALKRATHLERRLERKPELYQKVRNQIQDYLDKGTSGDGGGDSQYTERQGLVSSSERRSQPEETREVSVIIGFRERRIAFGGDFREMYHQLKIVLEDKQAQRFLFRNSSSESAQIYVMDVATFGSTCSPASAQYVKNRNAEEYATQFLEAVAAIIHRHYVDDYFYSVDTVAEALKRAQQVSFVHKQAGFEIRNWVSNSVEVLSGLGEDKPMEPVLFNQDKQLDSERVLGITWDPEIDVFAFTIMHRESVRAYLYDSKRPTKRIVLSCVMGFFDPLGLLSPFTVHGKIIIQQLWRSGCEWDQQIGDEEWCKWKQWTDLLPEVEALQIPRCYLGDTISSSVESLESHIFTDASEHAYGCVAYLRAIVNGQIHCSLVMSRAKVAPLELMAAVLGARLSQTILSSHSLRITKTVLWTDSRTVLSWLRSDSYKYKQFVAFRVGEILELTRLMDWRWIPSKQNIADVLTKWGQGPPLQNDSEWKNGPQILYQPEEFWPSTGPIDATGEEARGMMQFHAVVDAESVSRWAKLVRITATVLRFIANCQRKKNGLPIMTLKAT